MVQAAARLLSFDDYIEQYPEDGGRYELVDGELIEMRPIGPHEAISGFLTLELGFEIRRLQLPYFIPKTAVVKPALPRTGYLPDVIVLDKAAVQADPDWEKSSSVSQGSSVKLAIEVVSTNWRDDYLRKYADYEAMGIGEYWIADYLGQGGARFIGSPKELTLSVCQWVNGEYVVQLFKGNQRILSPTFPELDLTVNRIIAVDQ